jgi:hypothetical protein
VTQDTGEQPCGGSSSSTNQAESVQSKLRGTSMHKALLFLQMGL